MSDNCPEGCPLCREDKAQEYEEIQQERIRLQEMEEDNSQGDD